MNFRPLKTTGKWIALASIIALSSCKKDVNSALSSNDTKAATLSDSSTVAENSYYDVVNTAIEGYSDNATVMGTTGIQHGNTSTFSTATEGAGSNHLSCATYTISDSVYGQYPKTLTLDFGAGCSSVDGVLRKGKVIYTFSGPLFTPGTTISVSFNQYSVQGYGIQGNYTITNNSTQSGIILNTVVTNGIITYPDLTNYHYSHNKVYTQTAGSSTPFDITDDVYAITGNSAFTSSDGSSLVLNTSTPLIRHFTCLNITQGIVGFVYNQDLSGTIDFGDGTCDNTAILKVGNISQTITLR